MNADRMFAAGAGLILKRYGFFGTVASLEHDVGGVTLHRLAGEGSAPALNVRTEPGDALLWKRRGWWFSRRALAYHALRPHVSFTGPGVEPIWETADGRAVLAWFHRDGRRELLAGLDVVEEFVRHTQGDPAQVTSTANKGRWGFGHERPVYLYEKQQVAEHRGVPWADYLGYTLAESLAVWTGMPLIEPLPFGARGAVLLSGDDDQAYLEKYDDQLRCIGDFPITYFMLPWTRHRRETLAKLPPSVEYGVHVDALKTPTEYARCCREQVAAIRELCAAPVRSVRNHGFLSDGYEGHLPAWEETGIELDMNIPGLDGAVYTGSLLPFRLRRGDGSWSNHHSLLTAFGDGLLPIRNLSEDQGSDVIRGLARQIERNWPGVLVFNFHPQNIADTLGLHQTVMALGRRQGWVALGAESYLSWLSAREQIVMRRVGADWRVEMPVAVEGIAVRRRSRRGWNCRVLSGSDRAAAA
jgi:hypothetical protein